MTEPSQTWSWIDGTWADGNPLIAGPSTHAMWMGSSVFDGARYFEGVMPDLALHAERVNASALTMGLKPTMSAGEICELAWEGVKKFEPGTAVYIKPMYWPEGNGLGVISPDPETTRFCLNLFAAPMAPEETTFSVTLSPYRRPTAETAPVDAKAGCLYPNNARAVREARERGFDNALVRDTLGNIAELTSANIFMAKDGAVHTPYANGTFLNGITRQRVIKLLRDAGIDVYERSLVMDDFMDADEIFSTGNYSKVMSVGRIESREMQPGPLAKKARDLYWDFAHA
ncbi:branched-chain amino acid aminotransferase [Breoghania corrubedonensis]|uniref:Probable branched-chain-amino-acid aminotransferase n=1 Tax=Breoghania corrubedonensis TaxID=665038 RepID=A0A2T5UWE9_9HYPH|nr:branched-chain amino acid aminotransferase [Breoghania corrubedonensis]PTW55791.1 branched-chain amino acid aminotransferase [Breoghania corrubedonensis]